MLLVVQHLSDFNISEREKSLSLPLSDVLFHENLRILFCTVHIIPENCMPTDRLCLPSLLDFDAVLFYMLFAPLIP